MIRLLIVFAGSVILLSACTQRVVCPAYQSAFIYDKDELRKKFSYFAGDSTPKVFTASKSKYLVVEPVAYRKKIRSMQTVPAKPVYVSLPDSLSGKPDSVSFSDLDLAARSVIDSTYIVDVPKQETKSTVEDSVYVITKDREVRVLKYNTPDSLKFDEASGKYVSEKPEYYVKEVGFNTEEDNYMWYLRDVLVLPDARIARQIEPKEEEETTKREKGLKGFFKNLFKKKEKEPADSTVTEIPVTEQDDFDYIDEADTVLQAEIPLPEQEKKKGKGGKKSKESKKSKKKSSKEARKEDPIIITEPEEEKKKEEDDDDGF